MLAIPVKTAGEASAIAPLFGKAKWFAIVDDDDAITFWHNEHRSGRAVVEYFKSAGVTDIVFQDMGTNPFLLLENSGIASYHSGTGRILLKDAIGYFRDKALIRVNRENMAEYVESSHRHSKGGQHHEGHRHGHGHSHAH